MLCKECGMGLGAEREYHPYAACLMFKATQNTTVALANLEAVVEYGMKAQAAGIDLDQAMHDLTLVPREGVPPK